jgi:hypothetical protein
MHGARNHLYSAGQEACQRRLHCSRPHFISLRGGMRETIHEVLGNRPIGGEKPVADVQIRDDSARPSNLAIR